MGVDRAVRELSFKGRPSETGYGWMVTSGSSASTIMANTQQLRKQGEEYPVLAGPNRSRRSHYDMAIESKQ